MWRARTGGPASGPRYTLQPSAAARAGVRLPSGKIAVKVRLRYLVHEAARAVPVAFLRFLRQSRYVEELGMGRSQRPQLGVIIKFGARALAVDKRNGTAIAVLQQVVDHREWAGKARAAGHEQERCRGGLAHEEAPVRSADGQRITDRQALVKLARSGPARHEANIQLHSARSRALGTGNSQSRRRGRPPPLEQRLGRIARPESECSPGFEGAAP